MTGHRSLIAIVLLLASLCWPAQRAHATTTCSASATSLSFGTVTGAANVDNTAIVTVTCNTTRFGAATVRVNMCLNIGAGVNGNNQTNPRRMTNSFGDPLQFQIYRDPARSQIWGDSSIPATPTPQQFNLQYGVPSISGSGNVTFTMYGRVPAQVGVAAGSYSNPFTGSYTRLNYRYNENLLGGSFPDSCTSGGEGGGSTTFPFTASATVPNNCIIASADNLGFGSVAGTIAANRDQTSALTFTCTGRTAWNVGLNNGQNASGNSRRMRLGTSNNYVTYELYRDAAHTQRWGTTIGIDTATGTGSGGAQSLTVYGRVPATQAVPAGLYRDVITVTVTY